MADWSWRHAVDRSGSAGVGESLRALVDNLRWVVKKSWRSNPRVAAGFLATAALTGLLPAVAVLTVRGLINDVQRTAAAGVGLQASTLEWLALGFAVTAVLVLSMTINHVLASSLREDVQRDLSVELLEHVNRLPYHHFEQREFLDTLERAQHHSVPHMIDLLVFVVSMLVNLVQAATLMLLLLWIEPIVMVLLSAVGVPYAVAQWRLARRRFLEEQARAERSRWLAYYQGLLTGGGAVGEVRMLDLQPLFTSRYAAVHDQFRAANKGFHHDTFGIEALYVMMSTVIVYLAFTSAAVRAVSGELTLGDLAVFGATALRLRSAIQGVVDRFAGLRWQLLHVTSLRELFALADSEDEAERGGFRPEHAPDGVLRIRALDFTYPGCGAQVLHGVHLEAGPGEVVALVGENGSGKTTLAKLVAGLFEPPPGSIFLDGTDVTSLDRAFRRRHVACVFQDFNRYSGSAAENIALGRWRDLLGDREQVEAIAEAAGVHTTIAAWPDGYDTMLGRQFGSYAPSGGQWQQLALARALARDPRVLVLDEPTASLDARTEARIFEQMRGVMRRRTTILISHRFSTVSFADRIFVLHEGRIVEQGSHTELMRMNGHYSQMYRLQTKYLVAT